MKNFDNFYDNIGNSSMSQNNDIFKKEVKEYMKVTKEYKKEYKENVEKNKRDYSNND